MPEWVERRTQNGPAAPTVFFKKKTGTDQCNAASAFTSFTFHLSPSSLRVAAEMAPAPVKKTAGRISQATFDEAVQENIQVRPADSPQPREADSAAPTPTCVSR